MNASKSWPDLHLTNHTPSSQTSISQILKVHIFNWIFTVPLTIRQFGKNQGNSNQNDSWITKDRLSIIHTRGRYSFFLLPSSFLFSTSLSIVVYYLLFHPSSYYQVPSAYLSVCILFIHVRTLQNSQDQRYRKYNYQHESK